MSMPPTPTDLAREVLSRQRTRYEGQQPREDEVLAQALLDAAERERGLREALNEYGEHSWRCAWHDGTYDEPRYCDCGLDAALAAPSTEGSETR